MLDPPDRSAVLSQPEDYGIHALTGTHAELRLRGRDKSLTLSRVSDIDVL